MKLIQLTAENIEQYLDDCVVLQKQLLKPGEVVARERFIQVSEDSHSYLLGALIDDHIVALGEVCKIVHPVHMVGYVHNIVVDEAHRGKGLFTVVMNALEAQAVVWGCDQMNLTCSRPEVHPLYEKRGYEKKNTHFYSKHVA